MKAENDIENSNIPQITSHGKHQKWFDLIMTPLFTMSVQDMSYCTMILTQGYILSKLKWEEESFLTSGEPRRRVLVGNANLITYARLCVAFLFSKRCEPSSTGHLPKPRVGINTCFHSFVNFLNGRHFNNFLNRNIHNLVDILNLRNLNGLLNFLNHGYLDFFWTGTSTILSMCWIWETSTVFWTFWIIGTCLCFTSILQWNFCQHFWNGSFWQVRHDLILWNCIRR